MHRKSPARKPRKSPARRPRKSPALRSVGTSNTSLLLASIKCSKCDASFDSDDEYQKHFRTVHGTGTGQTVVNRRTSSENF